MIPVGIDESVSTHLGYGDLRGPMFLSGPIEPYHHNFQTPPTLLLCFDIGQVVEVLGRLALVLTSSTMSHALAGQLGRYRLLDLR